MNLICAECGNYTYFEADVEGLRAVNPTSEGLLIEDARFDDWNWSDSTLRDNLQDVVDYALKDPDELLKYDQDSGHYVNMYITCSRCGSKRVTIPYCDWHPPKSWQSLEKELNTNQKEFNWLRKEHSHDRHLPVLR